MSADNGFILRKREDGNFILQEYSASAEQLPEINAKGAMVYCTLEGALLAYERLSDVTIVEYGLSVNIQEVTAGPSETIEDKARSSVFQYVKERLGIERSSAHRTFREDEVYVVSVNENPGGWVALVSTSLPDGKLYEVVHLVDQKHTVMTMYMRYETVMFDD